MIQKVSPGPAPVRAGEARVVDLFGRVEKRLSPTAVWVSVSVGDTLAQNLTLRTATDAAALLSLADGHAVRVGASTTVVLKELGVGKRFSFSVVSGQVWSLVKKANRPAQFSVETPSAVAGVTGTFFGVALDESSGETFVSTGEGSVNVWQTQNSGAIVPVRAGFMTRVGKWDPRAARSALAAQSQSPEHRLMWRRLYSEGAWAQQGGRGAWRMRRERASEAELIRLMRARANPGAAFRPNPNRPGMIARNRAANARRPLK